MLIILTGSSGSGKNTIIKEVMKRKRDVEVMKTCTTRKPRNAQDDAYIFISLEEFQEKLKRGEFFEYEEVHKGIFYGTLKESLDKVFEEKIYMKDIDVCGAKKLKELLGENVRRIFLDVPKDELKRRLIERGESEESAEVRLSRYEFEKSFAKDYDLVIENKCLEDTVEIILRFLTEIKGEK